MKTYDAIVIGAGHNALVSAAYLARAGRSVLMLERRNITGGICVTEDLTPGFKSNSLVPGAILHPDIIRQLDLGRFGLQAQPASTSLVSLLPDGKQLALSNNTAETAASIAAFSKTDADKWPSFAAFMNRASAFLEATYQTSMPRLPNVSAREGLPLARLGLKLRGMGARDMYAIIRMLPMTAREFLDEWFESEYLKAAIATLGIYNANLGVMSAGSAYNLLHQYFLRAGWGQPQNTGGVGQISAALEAACRSYGVEIRTSTDVLGIRVKDNQVTGVTLVGGEQIQASLVLSSLDPRRTFLSLINPEDLDPQFIWKTRNIKMRGISASIHLVMDEAFEMPAGTLAIAPTLNYLEHAYDAAKYGQISEQPYLEVTREGQVVSVHIQYAPYHLKDACWDEAARKKVETIAIDTLEAHFPGLRSKILFQKTITPLDLETTYALTEGDLNHGQLMLDQFLFMRPLPGWSDHHTPITGLYLCGSGVHGGGGISGIPGRNAARQILRAG